jgi:hypothetical protein
MAAGKLDLLIEQGATFSRILTFKDVDRVVIDLTGCTFRGHLRDRAGNEKIQEFTFTLAAQTGDTKGQVTMSLTAEQTRDLPQEQQRSVQRTVKKLAYDVERMNADGTIDRVLEGIAQISPEVTADA